MEGVMKKTVFVLLISMSFIFASSLFAGEIYTYRDKDGNTVISNTPIPEKYAKKAKKVESYKLSTPEEIRRYQAEQAGIERRNAEESRQKRQMNEANAASRQAQSSGSQASVQASRNQRADKLKADAAARLRAVRDAGFNLPQANINLLEKAAEVKAEQIRQGTDTPMTAQEDADFHARQQQRDYEYKMRQQQSEIDRLKRGY